MVVLLILRRFAWGPLLTMMEAQEQAYTEAEKKVKELRFVARKLEKATEEIVPRAQERGNEIITRALATKKALVEEGRMEGEELKAEIVRRAHQQISQEREIMLDELKGQVSLLALGLTEKILSQHLTAPEQQQELAEQFLREAEAPSTKS